ncbi:Transcriptional factor IIA alpha/beta subunit [Mycena chlorophos]|uniref:Transcriptional factor IIA alpha/beta subunit n=1 Tax=Mycena chlorophos TaxID=658473 RepID=A0A8H6STW1_MYCCL|nr:Transcriptional factor IIA alpha/beta subunit [Mycena chlorophos]
MSNKCVPNVYRTVIDEVIAASRADFDEFGVRNEVLVDLQRRWEAKVIASRVAEFDPPAPVAVSAIPPPHNYAHYPPPLPQAQRAYPAPNVPMPQTAAVSALPVLPGPALHLGQLKPEHNVKSEPLDARYVLNQQYTLPPLPGPKLSLPTGPVAGASGRPPLAGHRAPPQATAPRIPQVDGPLDDSDDEEYDAVTPPPPSFLPRTSHPSLPQPIASSSSSQSTSSSTLSTPSSSAARSTASRSSVADSEAINSDLDDSDTEDEDLEDGAPNADILFCTYDRVARVKSKWKCILKEGMIHSNGKDYLFQRCTCEFNFEF